MAIALAALAGTVLSGGVARAQAFENIRSYDVQIQIQHDDSLRITETIEYDFGDQPHHGIFRDIPTRLHYDDTYDRTYPLTVESVTGSPGTPVNYSVKSIAGGKTEIKIGDPDQTITGVHTYTLVYSVGAAMNGFSDHDELYWNAVGDEWNVTIPRATVTVTAPGTIGDVGCFAGQQGSHATCDSARESGSTARFSQGPVYPYTGLTVVVGLPKGLVTDPKPTLLARWSLKRAFSLTPATGGTSAGLLVLVVGDSPACCGRGEGTAGSWGPTWIR